MTIKNRQRKEAEIAQEVDRFFGGVTNQEACEIFRILAILAQFPGATPPEPLTGYEIYWTSTMKVGDTLDKQLFDVSVIYKGLRFEYTASRQRVMQLPDSTLMNYESWSYQELLIRNRYSGK